MRKEYVYAVQAAISTIGAYVSGRLGIANSGKYDLVMELHLNASDKKEANGTEVLYKSAAGRRSFAQIKEITRKQRGWPTGKGLPGWWPRAWEPSSRGKEIVEQLKMA